MSAIRIATIVAAGFALSTIAPARVQAQFYGNAWRSAGNQYNGYYPGAYSVGGYYGSPYSGYSSSYSSYGNTYYGIGSQGYGANYGVGSYNGLVYPSLAPVGVGPSPIYGTNTTVIQSGQSGGVIQYTNNGNGYTYAPGSSYPTVVTQQPAIGLPRTTVLPSPTPVVIESRPQGSPGTTLYSSPTIGTFSSTSPKPAPMIKLSLPAAATGSLTYSLNGHVYTIQPGYSQTFPDDRAWTIEFLRGPVGSPVATYPLKAGTYIFTIGAAGWELQHPPTVSTSSPLPPSPMLGAPTPAATPTPLAPGPTPMPPN
jgi:hypothetical protein